MAGIIDQQMEQEPGETPEPPESAAQEEQERAAAPAAGAPAGNVNVDRVVMAASKALHQPEVMKQIIEMVRAAKSPAAGIAQALVMLMTRLYEISKGTMPEDVLVPAGQEIAKMIADICEAGGVLKATPEILQQAVSMAAAMALQRQGVDEAKAKQMAASQGG